MKELIEKYEKKLRALQREWDVAYENDYSERCDQLDETIDLLIDVIADLKVLNSF